MSSSAPVSVDVPVSIDQLYTSYAVLSDAKEKVTEHVKDYETIIVGVRGGEKEKQLASQIIAKFFKYFPSVQEQAIEALLDICEDDNSSIRKQAMKALPLICKDCKEHTAKIANTLSQLLQLEDPQEQNIASSSLINVITNDAFSAIQAIFKQIFVAEDVVREKCLKFLVNKYRALDQDILTKEIDELIIKKCKKLLKVCGSEEEFQNAMCLLTQTSMLSTENGRQEFVELAIEQAELNNDLDPLDKDVDAIDRLIVCVRTSLPYFSAKTNSAPFLNYICDQVLTQFDIIGSLDRGYLLQLELVKQLAELSVFYRCDDKDLITKNVSLLFQALKTYMPQPPENSEVEAAFPVQEYSIVECLLFAFHRLARNCPDFLTGDAELLRDFRLRLQYFARGVQSCLKSLKQEITEADFKKDDNKLKINSLKMTNNINTIIKDLFHSPPSYKSVLILSWKITEKTVKTSNVTDSFTSPSSTSSKRHVPITFDDRDRASKQFRASGTAASNGFNNFNKSRNTFGMGRSGGRNNGRNRSWAATNKKSWN